MNVEHTHEIDADEPDANGMHEYYYEYDDYRFTEGKKSFIARS
jgi:hypothetical protein